MHECGHLRWSCRPFASPVLLLVATCVAGILVRQAHSADDPVKNSGSGNAQHTGSPRPDDRGDDATCINGLPTGPPEPKHPVVKNLVKYLARPVNSKVELEDYRKVATKQCECYGRGSYRVRPPFLPAHDAPLDKVFLAPGDLPAFSVDESYFIISAHITLTWKQVVIIVADHVDSNYQVSGGERNNMKHGSDEVDIYCDFVDHRDPEKAGQKRHGPVWPLSHNDHHVRTIACNIPDSMLACLNRTRSASDFQGPRCIDVALQTGTRGDSSKGVYTVALLQICQYDRPERKNFLATCTQPMNSGVFSLVAPWIDHHHRIGIEHFYLYAEQLGLEHYAAPYLQRNIAEIKLWMDPREKKYWPIGFRPLSQVTAMNDCVYRLMDHAEWIAFFDVDEFMSPFKHNLLAPFLRPFTEKDVGAVRVYTWYFVNRGPDDGANTLLLSNYVREPAVSARERCKTIVRPRRVQMISVHMVMHGSRTESIDEHALRLNHHRAEYRGRVDTFDDSMKKYKTAVAADLQAYYSRTIPDY
ncbi:uncharacterized protein LOC135814668 [Sycon ciliatum]|uniref:uncharacterized protein LOC135814668 n=1 Tax=Sycon ciliatum TaxID=27933 RepID=UPI0031F64037